MPSAPETALRELWGTDEFLDRTGEALEVVARSRSRRDGDWWEWEEFCLSLSFSPSALAYLKSKLPELDSYGRAFALALLDRNELVLDHSEFAELVTSLQDIHNWSLDTGESRMLVCARAFPILERLVDGGSGERASRAAEALLKYHSGRLSERLYAKCLSLKLGGGPWRTRGLHDQTRRLETDKIFAAAVKAAAAEIVASGGTRPLLEAIRAALESPEDWRDVVWQLAGHGAGMGREIDDGGQWLLDHGRLAPEHGKAIGAAVVALLDDPRVPLPLQSEVRRWLTLLNDEFVGLPKAKLEEALVGATHSRSVVGSALIARLGYTPEGYRRRGPAGTVPVVPHADAPTRVSADELSGRLKDVTRSSETTHPNLCPTIEESLLSPPLEPEELAKLAAEGAHGALAASALSFAYGYPPSVDLAVRLLGGVDWPSQNDECHERLSRVFRSTHYGLIAENQDIKKRYVQLLDQSLATASDSTLAAIAAELLELAGEFTPAQTEHVLERYAGAAKYFDHGLGQRLARWLSRPLDDDTVAAAVRATGRGLRVLDNEPWDVNALWPSGALPFIVLPLAHWKLTDSVDEVSARVFERGVRFLFTGMRIWAQRGWDEKMPEWKEAERLSLVFEWIEPLMSSVPARLMRDALSRGSQSSDPVARSICNLLLAGFLPS